MRHLACLAQREHRENIDSDIVSGIGEKYKSVHISVLPR